MTTRTLTFLGSTHGKVYERLLEALRWGRQAKAEAPGMAVLKSERRIRRALRTIGTLDPQKSTDLKCPRCEVVVLKGDPEIFRLNPEGGTVSLEDGDWTFLRDYLGKVPWSGDAGEAAADADDFLAEATHDE